MGLWLKLQSANATTVTDSLQTNRLACRFDHLVTFWASRHTLYRLDFFSGLYKEDDRTSCRKNNEVPPPSLVVYTLTRFRDVWTTDILQKLQRAHSRPRQPENVPGQSESGIRPTRAHVNYLREQHRVIHVCDTQIFWTACMECLGRGYSRYRRDLWECLGRWPDGQQRL